MMNLKQRIEAFVCLGEQIEAFLRQKQKPDLGMAHQFTDWQNALQQAFQKNGWFVEAEVLRALNGILYMLDKQKLIEFTQQIKEPIKPLNIGVIMAGNIPMVGFHDFLCVLLSGHKLTTKTATQDEVLMPFLAEKLIKIEPEFQSYIQFTKTNFKQIDALIATGNNNSARYFEHYFSKIPHIIRKNRNSVAIINHDVTDEELRLLGNDIFNFFGLGCRNVTKLYLEKNFNHDRFFTAIYPFKYIIQHNKYANNYAYHQTIYLMNNEKLLENGFLMLKEDTKIASPIAMLFYEYYENETDLRMNLNKRKNEIQIIVSKTDVPFGQSQKPELWDYADNVNTLEFLAILAPRKF